MTATVNLTLAFTEVCRELDDAGYSEERIAYMTSESVNRVARTLDRLDGLRSQLNRAPSIEPVLDNLNSNPDCTTPRQHYGGRAPSPCGTYAAYKRHKAHGETPDNACREAHRAQQRAYRVAAKQAKGQS